MKLIYRILIRLSVVLSVVVAVWAFLFYVAIADEINEEVDDSLEDYSEEIMTRVLAGEELPTGDNGSSSQYYLSEVSPDHAERYKKKKDMYYTDEDTRVLSMIFRDKDDRYYELVVSTPTIEKDDLREAVLYWCIILYVFLLFTVVAVTTWVFYRSMKPLYVLLDWLDSYRIGKKNKPLEIDSSVTEFRKLSEATLRNAGRNEKMYEQQKQFIGNASHEIQTPLAICRNRLEGLMEDDSLTEAQMEELYKTHKTLEYITRLNKALLLLTKIDNGQFIDTADIELNPLIERYVEDFKDVYAYRRISVAVEEEGVCRVTMNESLAASLFSNLIKNAFVHNIEGGQIHIASGPGRFVIRNTGEDGPLDRARIFERFYQGHKKEGSTGLGLAIAHSICAMQGFHLSYDYVGGEHLFCVKY
ncbi:HAMP domain-containing sensor histidine kinase [uncultured Parabacteroides sp.]|uniref:sensor histidine kinase n=1 Tax=uncultured Parabacteroides sp. TaxID=512312 RepID=UPI002635C694|nr:HAMP domain-containing sensor histidine kinase [uncultured Parabacteroides sp.]